MHLLIDNPPTPGYTRHYDRVGQCEAIIRGIILVILFKYFTDATIFPPMVFIQVFKGSYTVFD